MSIPNLLPDPWPAIEAFLASGGRAITFDVFDTLLWRRTLYPADAFALLPHGRLGRVLRPRVEAVITAVCRRLLGREPRLADIYGACYPFDPAAELALEARLAVANPYCHAAVHKLVATGVPVVAVSDMYLSGAQIAVLLKTIGYPDLPVFSSADAGVSKRVGGRLFAHAAQRLGMAPAEMLHLGDDWHADVAMARQQGLASQHLQPPRDTLFALRPALAQARPRGADSLFWGELAIALHGSRELQARDHEGLKARLAHLLAQPHARQQSPQSLAAALLEEAP